MSARFAAYAQWFRIHRAPAIVIGVMVLFGISLIGGYWLAQRLDSRASDATVRETLQDMKRNASAPAPAQPEPKYTSIDEILPRYTELDPGQRAPTHEEKPRTRPPQVAAAAGVQ